MSEATNGSLLQRLEAAAQQGAKLYHASRVVLGVRPQLPPAGEPVSRWWSGVEAAEGWQAFLGAERVFEAREYERRSRWHQSCYHGAAERVNEYTLLAAEACGVLPMAFVLPRGDFHRGILHANRDAWTFFLYRLAVRDRAAFGLDIHGLPPYADFAFPGLEVVVACTSTDPDRDEQMLTRFRDQFHGGSGRVPECVYAGLRLDVFSASVLGLNYLIEHKDELYGSPDALKELNAATMPEAIEANAAGDIPERGGVRPRKRRKKSDNDARDLWMYEQRQAGKSLSAIRGALAARSTGPDGWEVLDTDQGIFAALVRYARRKGLPQVRKSDPIDG